eukprot:CAMPEP_0119078426 /NCGR_PEP_ID=MMETSP1178-20130426/100769_1 /TAXON_ID=33656 /ORGANISM="unid sp, Strain CCMP2000" /LENGTH=187 /DNA_ID=CAMNT_0007060875 /DNA_START=169 /DNA_END=730 /DNA_ORIENTATION=+
MARSASCPKQEAKRFARRFIPLVRACCRAAAFAASASGQPADVPVPVSSCPRNDPPQLSLTTMDTQQLQPVLSSSMKSVSTAHSSICQQSSPHAVSSTRSSRFLRLDSRFGVADCATGSGQDPSGTRPYNFSNSAASAMIEAWATIFQAALSSETVERLSSLKRREAGSLGSGYARSWRDQKASVEH